MKLLLVDSRLKDISTIVSSLQIDTKYVVVDYLNDTFANVVSKISALNETSFNSIAYMAHGEYKSYYKMLNKQNTYSKLIGVQNVDANLSSWTEINNFWSSLINTYNVSFIDYLGCCLIDKNEWVYIFNTFNTIKQGTVFRGSSDNTGNMKGSNWILETDGTNVKDLYFTDNILNYKYNLYDTYYGIRGKLPLKTLSGSVVSWGSGGDQTNSDWSQYIPPITPINVTSNLTSNVVCIYSTFGGAFAALKEDGSVITWGNPQYGADKTNSNWSDSSTPIDVTSDLTSNVDSIYSTQLAFAALKNNGSVVTWGEFYSGGDRTNSNWITNPINVTDDLTSNVISIYSTESAFAALKNDGSVVTWGDPTKGGDKTNSRMFVYDPETETYIPLVCPDVTNDLTSNVVSIYSTHSAFAALKNNGSVVTWGYPFTGGNSSSVASSLTSNVVSIYSTTGAFAALKNDGSVITWGDSGGDSSSVASSLTSNVISIYSTGLAFAALKNDGSVITWGFDEFGGNPTYSDSGVTSINVTDDLTSGVVSIHASQQAFAALKNDGSVITWGGKRYGGSKITDWVTDLYIDVTNDLTSGVVSIYSTERAFAALKNDGSVVTWGENQYGGDKQIYSLTNVWGDVSNSLTSNVISIYSTGLAFAAIKNDGSVITWGSSGDGGDSSNVSSSLTSNVVSIYSTYTAFAAIKTQSMSVSIASYSDKHKIDVLKTSNKYYVSDSNLTITGDTSINSNLKNGLTYNLYKNTGTNIDISGSSYIPTIDDEIVIIKNVQYKSNQSGVYYLNNGLWTPISNPVTIDGLSYNLYKGSIILELVNTLSITYTSKTSSSITFSLSGTDSTNGSATHIVYIASGSDNISTIASGTSVLLTSLTNNGGGSYTLTGLNSSTEYSIISKTSNDNSTNRVRQTTSAAPSGGGDPHIETVNGIKYDLPNDENCYLLFDNNNPNDRVRITTKSWFLPTNRMYAFWNNLMEDTSFFRYVNIQHNNENLTIDLENLNIVEYDERNIKNHSLRQTTNKTTIRISDKYEDKNILSRHYGDYKRNLYKIKFNGISRKININTNNTKYEIRVSCDLNCADERNEISLHGNSFEGCTGAFISESQAIMIQSLI